MDMQGKQQQLEPDMEQRTGSKLRKEYIKAVYCHPAYLTDIQNTSCEMCTEALISQASKIILKILQTRLQQYVH